MSSYFVRWFMTKYFGDYFEDLENSMINMSLSDKKLEITNIRINKRVIEMLEWPIDLCYSCI